MQIHDSGHVNLARSCALCSCFVVRLLPAHTCSSACFTEWYVRHAMHIRLLSLAGDVLTSPATPREGSLRSSWEPCRAAPNHRSPRCHRQKLVCHREVPPPRPNDVLMPNPDARPRCTPGPTATPRRYHHRTPLSELRSGYVYHNSVCIECVTLDNVHAYRYVRAVGCHVFRILKRIHLIYATSWRFCMLSEPQFFTTYHQRAY